MLTDLTIIFHLAFRGRRPYINANGGGLLTSLLSEQHIRLTPSIHPTGSWFEPSPRQAAGKVHRKDESLFSVRSLTPPQAARNVLAVAVQQWWANGCTMRGWV